MTTLEVITPVLVDTYGDVSMVHSLAEHLAEKIDTYERPGPPYGRLDTREGMIFDTCWNWFSGGSTAAAVARQIEEALLFYETS